MRTTMIFIELKKEENLKKKSLSDINGASIYLNSSRDVANVFA